MMEETILHQSSKSEWNEVRTAFLNSLMVDTPISSLAQNLELEEGWPIEGKDEVPSKYIGFSWEEINLLPDLATQPGLIGLLINILRETMAFDDPFSEMADSVEDTTKSDESITRTLNELKIPMDMPLDFSLLEEDTLDFCTGESVTTIGEFVSFSERLARSGLLLGGNLQGLLNALIVRDESMIAKYLPYRPQVKGVYLVEAFDILVRKLSDTERNSLLKRYGSTQIDSNNLLDSKSVNELELKLLHQARKIARFFGSDMLEIYRLAGSGTSFESFFVRLNDESKILISGTLLRKLLQSGKRSGARKQDPVHSKRRGFFARLFKRS